MRCCQSLEGADGEDWPDVWHECRDVHTAEHLCDGTSSLSRQDRRDRQLCHQRTGHWEGLFSSLLFFSLLFSSGQTAIKLSGAEAADLAQCAAPDKPIGIWNLLVAFANLKRVIQCACFKSLGSRKGTPKCNLRILAVAQHLPRKWRLVSSSSLQRGHTFLYL